MNYNRMFIPNMVHPPMMHYPGLFAPNPSIFTRIANGLKKINLAKIMSGTSKTLNVMNQAIPLIRQAKPMIHNVKSMMELAKAFKTETNKKEKSKLMNINTDHSKYETNEQDNYPTFFI